MAAYDLGTARGTIELNASSLARASMALRTVGLGLIGVGAAAIAGFGYAVNKAATFEQKMSAVQAVLGINDKAMEKAKQQALDLGANSVYGATQVAIAMEDLAKAGLTIEEIVGGAARATIDLAQASGGTISLARAAEIAANAMRTFGLDSSQLTHLVDQLAGAANASTLEIEDIAVSLRYVGPVANAAGLGIDDLSTALAVLGDRGIRGSTAGTSLRGVLLGLIAPTTQARKVLKELGIITADGGNIMFDSSGKMKSLAEVSQLLQDKTAGLTGQQKNAAFSAIFQRRAMASALVLAEQGAAGFDKYSKAIGRVSAADVAAKKLDNLKGDVRLLQSQLESAVIRAGTPFQNMLRQIVQGLTLLIGAFGRLSPRTQTIILAFLAISGALLVAAGSFLFIAGTMIRMYRTFRDLQAGIKLAMLMFRSFTASLLLNPVFLIIAAIVLLVIAFVILWVKVEGFRNFWKRLWKDLQEFALTAWNGYIKPVVEALADFFTNTLPEAVSAGWQALQTAFDNIRDFFGTTLGKAVLAGVALMLGPIGLLAAAAFLIVRNWGSIRSFFADLWGSVSSIFGRAVAFVGRQMTLFNRWFGKNVMPTVRAFVEFLQANFTAAYRVFQIFWIIVKPILNQLLIFFKTQFGVIASTLKLAGSAISTFATIAIAWFRLVATTLTAVWSPVWLIIQTVMQVALLNLQRGLGVFAAAFLAVWTPFWGALTAVVQIVWTLIKTVIAAALKIIQGIFQVATGLLTGEWGKAWEGILNILSGAWQLIFGVFRAAWNLLFTIVGAGIATVVGFFRTVPGKIVSAIGDVVRLLWEKGQQIVASLIGAVIESFEAVWTFFASIKDKVLGFFKDAGTWLLEIGRKIIQGLIDGITAAIGGIKDAVGGIASKVINWVNPPPAEGWLRDIGARAIGGLLAGLESGMPAVKTLLTQASQMATTLNTSGLASTSTGMSPNLVRAGAQTQRETKIHVVEKGDTVQIDTHTEADPEDIVNAYFWAKRVRL